MDLQNGDVQLKIDYSQAVITGNYTNSGNYYSDSMSYWDSLGGILGASYTGTATLTDCWFDGEIIVNSIQAPVGGIAGYTENAAIDNCSCSYIKHWFRWLRKYFLGCI